MNDTTTPRLSAEDAIAYIERQQKMHSHRDWRLTIAISNPGGLTAHQTVEVKAIEAGFDWTAGQLILRPAAPLSRLTAEQVADVTKSVRAGSSWHAYEREKKNRAEVATLQAENARLVRDLQLMTDDRDSWREQADERTSDALRFAGEGDALKASMPDIEEVLRLADEYASAKSDGREQWPHIANTCAKAAREELRRSLTVGAGSDATDRVGD